MDGLRAAIGRPLGRFGPAECRNDFRHRRYLLAVNVNQPTLHDAVPAVFAHACEADFVGATHDGAEAVGDAYVRHEGRYTTVVCDLHRLPPESPDVPAVILVGGEREVGGGLD